MQMTPLKWFKVEGGQDADGRWACASTAHTYPSLQQSLLHPCTAAADAGGCCGDTEHTRLLLRFTSYFQEDNALLLLAYEVG